MAELSILALHGYAQAVPDTVRAVLVSLGVEEAILVTAWEVSEVLGLDPRGQAKAFALLTSVLAAQGQGHTRMAWPPGPGSPGDALLRAFNLEAAVLTEWLGTEAGARLVGGPEDVRPLVQVGPWLTTHRLHAQERQLVVDLAALLQAGVPERTPVGDEVFSDPVELSEEQRQAVRLALSSPVALISGGPGTGKTSIVVAILRALLRQEGLSLDDIALAAPTGKAAQRMGEAIRRSLRALRAPGEADELLIRADLEPRTLHRLLAWNPVDEAFRHGPEWRLAARVVVVDEASMISLEHLHRLLAALAPGTRLVLLGDADQLPSVDPGSAFRELVEGLEGQVAHLRQSFRMRPSDPEGRAILSAARCIREGNPEGLWEGAEAVTVRSSAETLEGRRVELIEPEPGRTEAVLLDWFRREVSDAPGFLSRVRRTFTLRDGRWGPGDEEALAEVFRHLEASRLLCALREAADLRGVVSVNALMHQELFRLTGEGLRSATAFCAGEPVMMTTNDYRRGLFNGDQGVVLKVALDGQLRQAVVFPRLKGFAAFPLEPLRHQLDAAFAITIHKAQGSEYDRIAILLPRGGHRALTRELLYTALTRARRAVTLVADPECLHQAAQRPTARETGLGDQVRRTVCRTCPGND